MTDTLLYRRGTYVIRSVFVILYYRVDIVYAHFVLDVWPPRTPTHAHAHAHRHIYLIVKCKYVS